MECGDTPLFDSNDRSAAEFVGALQNFQDMYRTFHRHIAVVFCMFGILANIVHIWVLTRPRMRTSSVHTVLICIAVSDICTMISYFIYMLRFEYFQDAIGYRYWWAMFLELHVIVSIACHAITLYLVVLMAYIRYSAMKSTTSVWLNRERACFASLFIAFCVVVVCVPTLLAHQVRGLPTDMDDGSIEMRYSIGFSDMMLMNSCLLLKGNLWLTGIFLKAIPCFLMFWLTLALIYQLRTNREKRKTLLNVKEDEKAKRRGDLTTYMLLLMVSVFLFTELPQGIMAILNALFTTQFHRYVYMPLSDLLDLLSLVNCYVAFLVYICTCSRYRQTLLGVLPQFNRIFSSLTTRQNTMLLKDDRDRRASRPMVPSPLAIPTGPRRSLGTLNAPAPSLGTSKGASLNTLVRVGEPTSIVEPHATDDLL